MTSKYMESEQSLSRYLRQNEQEYDLGDGRVVSGVPEPELVKAFEGDEETLFGQALGQKNVKVYSAPVSASDLPEEYQSWLGFGEDEGMVYFYSKA